jgi:hypothetical protein
VSQLAQKLKSSMVCTAHWRLPFRDKVYEGVGEMTIQRLLQDVSLGPEEVTRLVEAYEITLRALRLTNRDDAMTRIIARTIIEVGQTGVIEPAQISELAIRQLGIK